MADDPLDLEFPRDPRRARINSAGNNETPEETVESMTTKKEWDPFDFQGLEDFFSDDPEPTPEPAKEKEKAEPEDEPEDKPKPKAKPKAEPKADPKPKAEPKADNPAPEPKADPAPKADA